MTVDQFIKRMIAMFGEPNTNDPAIYIAETRRALVGWRGDILEEAAARIVKTAKWFPKPAEVIDACAATAANKTNSVEQPKNTDWMADALKTADRLIYSEMGRNAADAGWITQLHDHCRKTRRLPHDREVSGLMSEANMFSAAYAEVAAGKGGTLQGALHQLGDSMLIKRNRLAVIAHGNGRDLTDISRRQTGEHHE